MNALVLDAGALVAIDRDDRDVRRKAGELLAAAGLTDAIDPTVALLADPGDRILTSDPDDLQRLCEAAGNNAWVVRC